ncbi:MAG: methionine--tRNA ligase subunit beta [Candidatus Sungbacteria bacterium RIFCSPLOWO2_01_FULL_59_16]|uniref:Methionine--tRNA ligase n=1 Tax=Candidatus Sungbacteria bacterium RIFCSPLOWO2_01_FULL_59_16 TaxID=1802280 RepID=A0A1G2LEZ3_9BACT|nr:MAG: methionine--tRNA ligase subunit beta [Candidatus Sungbacteria bacterium RIFCSPLOWO2_01_FULL_59_16]
MISYDDFQNIELRVAKILAAERVPGSEKLLKLRIGLEAEERQIIAGIGKRYEPEKLIGREIVIVANLEPRMLMGLESKGMLLAADCGNEPVLLTPDREVPPGARVR